MCVRLGPSCLQLTNVVGDGEHSALVQHTLDAQYEVLQFVILNAVVVRAG